MPWKVSGLVDHRIRFVLAYETGLYGMTELARQFGISRQKGYKWLHRYQNGGLEDLHDRSRAPRTSPHRMAARIEELLLGARESHPSWGPRKILPWLARKHPELAGSFPAASTVGDLLHRQGLVKPRKRRRVRSFPVAGALRAEAPNEVWTADFKGEFRLGSGAYCYPFTLVDAFSRYVLACRAEPSTGLQGAQNGFTEAFRRYGLPRAIRTDNGTPFVGHGVSGLSQLGVWWIKLGIEHHRIPQARPDQNGAHERMHRTLKAEATRPPEGCFTKQQARFERFCCEFNQERPHEAIEQRTPASCYAPSSREFPERIVPPEYPAHFELRKVDAHGHFKFRGHSLFIAHPMANERLGLLEIDDDIWSVRFYGHELGRISPGLGNFVIKVSPMSPV